MQENIDTVAPMAPPVNRNLPLVEAPPPVPAAPPGGAGLNLFLPPVPMTGFVPPVPMTGFVPPVPVAGTQDLRQSLQTVVGG